MRDYVAYAYFLKNSAEKHFQQDSFPSLDTILCKLVNEISSTILTHYKILLNFNFN